MARRLVPLLAAAVLLTGCGASPVPTSATPTHHAPSRAVGLGDSIMAGTNCRCEGPMAAYADAVVSERGTRPDVTNLGVAGWTTDDLRSFVTTDADARAALARADTVLVIIGANDLFRLGAARAGGPDPSALPGYLTTLAGRLDETLAAVREAHGDGDATFLVAGYWDILSADDDPEGTASLAMEAVNATICAAAEDAGMGFVDLDHAFAKAGGASGLVSNDGLHPDAEGVRVIGEAFAAATP